MKRLAFVDQMSDRPTNRRLITISRPTSYLDDQAKTERCPADQHSSPPPVLGSIRPIRVNYIEATSVHHAGTNLRSTARVEPPPPPVSRRRRRLCRAAAAVDWTRLWSFGQFKYQISQVNFTKLTIIVVFLLAI